MLIWIGRILGLIGLLVLGADVISWIGGAETRFSDIGEWWHWIDSGSLQVSEAAITRYLHPELWYSGVYYILLAPAAIVFLVLAGVFIGLGRWRRRRIEAREE